MLLATQLRSHIRSWGCTTACWLAAVVVAVVDACRTGNRTGRSLSSVPNRFAAASRFSVARCSNFAATSGLTAVAVVAVVLLVEEATDLVAQRTLRRAARSDFAAACGEQRTPASRRVRANRHGVTTSVAAVRVMAEQAKDGSPSSAAADQQGGGRNITGAKIRIGGSPRRGGKVSEDGRDRPSLKGVLMVQCQVSSPQPA